MLSVIFVVLIVTLSKSCPWADATLPTTTMAPNRTSRLVCFMARTINPQRWGRRDRAGPKRHIHGELAHGAPKKPKAHSRRVGLQNPGSVLLSHRVAPAVPSALKSLTSVFGMGTGVTSSV